MNKLQAIAILRQLHNLCISKGIYQNVDAVNQVTTAIRIMELPEKINIEDGKGTEHGQSAS